MGSFVTLAQGYEGHYYESGNNTSSFPISFSLLGGKTYWYLGDIGPSGEPNGIGQFRVTINGVNEIVYVPDYIANYGKGDSARKQEQTGTGWMNLPGLGLAPGWFKNFWLWLIALLALIYILKRK